MKMYQFERPGYSSEKPASDIAIRVLGLVKAYQIQPIRLSGSTSRGVG